MTSKKLALLSIIFLLSSKNLISMDHPRYLEPKALARAILNGENIHRVNWYNEIKKDIPHYTNASHVYQKKLLKKLDTRNEPSSNNSKARLSNTTKIFLKKASWGALKTISGISLGYLSYRAFTNGFTDMIFKKDCLLTHNTKEPLIDFMLGLTCATSGFFLTKSGICKL